MAARWRNWGAGPLVCAAMTEPETEDIYLDDTTHHALITRGLIYADRDHEKNALWHWIAHITPAWMFQREGESC